MSNPKRHHYVPQFLQGPFTGQDGKLFVHRKGTSLEDIFTCAPKDVFLERYIYSTLEEDGARNPAQETAYAALDGAASSIVRKLISAAEAEALPCLTREERTTWDLFFYQQMKRVPGMIAQLEERRSFADRFKDVLPRLEAQLGRPLTETELDEFDAPDFQARVRQNAIVKALADNGKTIQLLLSVMALRLGVSRSATPFLLASRPVARLGGAPEQPITDQHIAVWLPIAPAVAVGPIAGGAPEQMVELHDDQVFAINDALAKESDIIASADLGLLKSYVSR
jgi:hypothetical protein